MTILPIRAPERETTLESVISTAELNQRQSRPPDYAAESRALVLLAQEITHSPEGILQRLAEVALSLCRAHSTVISLLTKDGKRFCWSAIAGRWAAHLGGGTTSDFGPCGTVLERNAALLFSHPERYFTYLTPLAPAIEEALFIPFYGGGKAVGALWIIAHDQSCRFDTEDLRLLMSLRDFASAAYQQLLSMNALTKAHEALRQTNDELELRVAERTRELQDQVEQTKRAENNLRDLTGHLFAAQDEERRHLARELHDGVGQVLAGLSYILAGLKISRSQDHALVEVITDGKAIIDKLVADIRTLSYLMHPPLLDELGLGSALRSYAEGFSERSKIALKIRVDANLGRLSSDLEIAIFRIVQESLTNVHQHSGSTSAAIRVSRHQKQVEVEVSDQGCGISPQRQHELAMGKIGLGVRGMQERVRQLGGKVELNSNAEGTHVSAVFPTGRRATKGTSSPIIHARGKRD